MLRADGCAGVGRKLITLADLDAYKQRTRPDREKPKGKAKKYAMTPPRITALINFEYNTVQPWADVGLDEIWYQRLTLGLSQLLMGIFPLEKRQFCNEALLEICGQFVAARKALDEIDALAKLAFSPVVSLELAYSQLYQHLWKAYSDRFKYFAHVLGYDIRFLFSPFKDRGPLDYEAGLQQLVLRNPIVFTPLIKVLTEDRDTWHKALQEERNAEEHRGDRLIKSQPLASGKLYDPGKAHEVFANVWLLIEAVAVCLIAAELAPPRVILCYKPDDSNSTQYLPYRLAIEHPHVTSAS